MSGVENVLEQERELGVKPIKPLFIKYSLVTFYGMLAQLIMVIIEGVIIGNGLGADGFGTIALFMPLETLNLALGGFFGLGISTVVGIKLGEKDYEGARKTFGQGFWFTTIFMLVLSTLIFINAKSVARFLGASEGYYYEDLVVMIRIFMMFYPFCILGQVFSYVGRVDEKPGLVSWVWAGAAFVAIVWLYVSIFLFNLSYIGAAAYYGLSIGLFFILVLHFLFGKTNLKIKFGDLAIDFNEIKKIAKIGLPTFLISASLFVYSIVINNILTSVGTPMDVAAYGLINGYVIYIINMVCQSFQAGFSPIVSYNYGQKSFERLKDVLKFGNIVNFGVSGIIGVLIVILAKPVVALFAGGDAELIAHTATITRYIVILFAAGSMSGMMSTYYQSIEKVTLAIVFGISRYILFALPLILILPNAGFGITGVWIANPIADLLTGILCVVIIVRELNKLNGKKVS